MAERWLKKLNRGIIKYLGKTIYYKDTRAGMSVPA